MAEKSRRNARKTTDKVVNRALDEDQNLIKFLHKKSTKMETLPTLNAICKDGRPVIINGSKHMVTVSVNFGSQDKETIKLKPNDSTPIGRGSGQKARVTVHVLFKKGQGPKSKAADNFYLKAGKVYSVFYYARDNRSGLLEKSSKKGRKRTKKADGTDEDGTTSRGNFEGFLERALRFSMTGDKVMRKVGKRALKDANKFGDDTEEEEETEDLEEEAEDFEEAEDEEEETEDAEEETEDLEEDDEEKTEDDEEETEDSEEETEDSEEEAEDVEEETEDVEEETEDFEEEAEGEEEETEDVEEETEDVEEETEDVEEETEGIEEEEEEEECEEEETEDVEEETEDVEEEEELED